MFPLQNYTYNIIRVYNLQCGYRLFRLDPTHTTYNLLQAPPYTVFCNILYYYYHRTYMHNIITSFGHADF